jgi:hypothetical protein
MPNPTPRDPDGSIWARNRAAAVAKAIGGFSQLFEGGFAVFRKGQREPALIVQYVAPVAAVA